MTTTLVTLLISVHDVDPSRTAVDPSRTAVLTLVSADSGSTGEARDCGVDHNTGIARHNGGRGGALRTWTMGRKQHVHTVTPRDLSTEVTLFR
ncbi:hypothetical protein BgiBS90_009419 [Biomphalaria glabrata]|nr:hypothetical protein BgiBS90_009419 [Biomphalaria glabrata]